MSKIKVLFICLGNICRSPLAEAVFNDYIEKHNLANKFEADSAGTASYHIGSQPDERTIKVAKKHGMKIEHKARQISEHDFDYYDYILVMDHLNYDEVTNICREKSCRDKIFLLRSFDASISEDSEYTIPDPYYGLDSDFEDVYYICKRSIQGFMHYLASVNKI